MKSVREMLESYSFEDAKKDLQDLIERNFEKKKSDTEVPSIILKCFLINIEKTKSFFKELPSKGYSVKFVNDKVIISLEEDLSLSFATAMNDKGLSRLMGDKSLLELVVELIKKDPEEWKKNYNPTNIKGQTEIYYYKNQESKLQVSINLEKQTIYNGNSDARFSLTNSQCYILKKYLEQIRTKDSDFVPTGRNNKDKKNLEQLLEDDLKKELGYYLPDDN